MDVSDLIRDSEVLALDLIGQEPPDVLQRLVRVALSVSGASGAAVNVITGGAQRTLVSAGSAAGDCAASESFCATIVREPERQHVVPDARLDPRFADMGFARRGEVVTYAASQLVSTSGVPIGTLCVFDPEPREVGAEVMAVLAELSEAVMEVLESRRQFASLHDALNRLTDGSRELRRSNEHLAAFAGQVAHDVQGPLSAVLMGLQLLQEEHEATTGTDPTDAGMLLETALSGAQRMRATVSGLMEVAVLGGRLRRADLDPAQLVAEVLVDLAAHRGHARVVVEDLPTVWGDHVQVRAVLQNLVANALKYAGDRATVTVSGSVLPGATAGDDGVVRISVADDGPGVPPEQREEVFGLMVRGDGVERTGVDGMGIGLATCRRIVESHGGRIGVGESAAGGADVWFELPVRPGSTASTTPAGTATVTAEAEAEAEPVPA